MNDRVVLIGAAILAAVVVSFGALWVLHDYAVPVFLNGEKLARNADIMVGDMIAARFPGVRVGPARCPRLVDLTGGRHAQCAIPINGEQLAISVAMRRDRRGIDYGTLDDLFVKDADERAVAVTLEERYGVPFAVRCPGAAVHVLAMADPLACQVRAPGVSQQEVPASPIGYAGDVRVGEVGGVTSREARVLGTAVAEQREGTVTIEGRSLERYLRGSASFMDHGEVGRHGLVGAAHCPARSVLHEGTHVHCSVVIADVRLTYDVHFEKGLGLRADRDTSVAVVPVLRDFATRYFHHRRLAAHITYNVDVNCGTVPVIVIEPGSTFRCHADVGGEPFYFAFRFLDSQGGFTMEESNGP